MNNYGEIQFSFRDHRGPVWAMFILGLALLIAAGLLGIVGLVEMPTKTADVAAFALMLGLCGLPGAALAALGLRDLVRPPVWHISVTHAFRTRGPRVVKSITFADKSNVQLTEMIRFGKVFGVQVDLDKATLIAPSTDVARAIEGAWRAARR